MIHPHTEVRFVSPEIGYGVFATQPIPRGTITWVQDQLDREFTPEEVAAILPVNIDNLMKYTYRNKKGNYLFCWDLTRFVNHSFEPNTMLTAMNFEIALKDIQVGEEITNDYGTFNLIEAFECLRPSIDGKRTHVRPDDLVNYHSTWDKILKANLVYTPQVTQPLLKYLNQDQLQQLDQIKQGTFKYPSVLGNYFKVL